MERKDAIGFILSLCIGSVLMWLSISFLAYRRSVTTREYLLCLVSGPPNYRILVPVWKRLLVGFGRIWAIFLAIAGTLLLFGSVVVNSHALSEAIGPFSAGLTILFGVRIMWRGLDAWVQRGSPTDDHGT